MTGKPARRTSRALAHLSLNRAEHNAAAAAAAVEALRWALYCLTAACAPYAAAKVRAALRSARGAERHARAVAARKRVDAAPDKL